MLKVTPNLLPGSSRNVLSPLHPVKYFSSFTDKEIKTRGAGLALGHRGQYATAQS